MDMLRDVKDFCAKFGIEARRQGETFDREVVLFRLTCLLEELQELSEALNNDDLAGATDALVDLIYFTLGTAVVFNLPVESAWQKVHLANMAKERVTSTVQSKRGSLADVRKPAGWVPPDIAECLEPLDKALHDSRQLDLEDYLSSVKVGQTA